MIEVPRDPVVDHGGEPPILTLYSRADCHLCDDMARELELLQRTQCFEFAKVEIDGDPTLARDFGHRIPVLVAGAVEICAGRVSVDRLRAFLRGGGDPCAD